MAAERRVHFSYRLDRRFDLPGHVDSGPLAMRRGASQAAVKSRARCEGSFTGARTSRFAIEKVLLCW